MRCLSEPGIDRRFHGDSPIEEISSVELAYAGWPWWPRFSPKERLHASQPPGACWQATVVVDHAAVSQFDLLSELAENGTPLPDSLCCLALTGSGFHGHRRRPWQALRGNLHWSGFRRLRLDAARCGPALSMAPTLAVTDVLRPLVGDRCSIKWVNDVLLDGAKVSGTLVSSQITGDSIDSFVMGIGLNLTGVPDLESDELAETPTCLWKAADVSPELPEVFASLSQALAGRINQLLDPAGPELLFAEYLRRSSVVGRRVSVYPETTRSFTDEVVATGRLLAIHPDLSLEIEGYPERLRAGRLRVVSG